MPAACRGQIRFLRKGPDRCTVKLTISYEVPGPMAPFASVSGSQAARQPGSLPWAVWVVLVVYAAMAVAVAVGEVWHYFPLGELQVVALARLALLVLLARHPVGWLYQRIDPVIAWSPAAPPVPVLTLPCSCSFPWWRASLVPT